MRPLRDLNALNVRDFLEQAARAVPDETFLIHGQETISYREFDRRVDVAACAWHELGIRKGDRVAFMLENRPEFLQAWLGLAKIGATLAAFNTHWQAAEVDSKKLDGAIERMAAFAAQSLYAGDETEAER